MLHPLVGFADCVVALHLAGAVRVECRTVDDGPANKPYCDDDPAGWWCPLCATDDDWADEKDQKVCSRCATMNTSCTVLL
jgi:hypothetical protein